MFNGLTRLLQQSAGTIGLAWLIAFTSIAMAENGPVVPDKIPKQAQLFSLGDVHLLPGYIKDKQDLNSAYLLSLNPERFLVNFRTPAGLPTTAQPYGGWESVDSFCRGHFTGHYLSACAESYAVTGDPRFKAKCDELVAGLAECQKAFGKGYLGPVRPYVFECLEKGQPLPKDEPHLAVPYYVIHKLMAGLLDTWRYTGNKQALEVACGMGDYFGARLRNCSADQIDHMFDTERPYPPNEFGGMSEAMQNLYAATGNKEYLETARYFNRDWFLNPLENGEDKLTGLHCNCHVPQVLGAARDYELEGNAAYKHVAENFWNLVEQTRIYPHGGSSGINPQNPDGTRNGEHWSPAGQLAAAMGPKMAESCVAHNLLKLTERLFTWQPSVQYTAYYERTYFNTVLGTQKSGEPGHYLYSLPLADASRKVFGGPDHDFWCCYGTGVEAFSRLAEPIYYHSDTALWVTLFVASQVDWKEKGISIQQTTNFPFENETRLLVHANRPVELTLNLYIPSWVSNPPEIRVLGNPISTDDVKPGSFYPIHREWKEGDTVELILPMAIRSEALPGNSGLTSLFYGPILLAGVTDHALEFGGSLHDLEDSVKPDATRPFTFQIKDPTKTLELRPLFQIEDETYSVFFKPVLQ